MINCKRLVQFREGVYGLVFCLVHFEIVRLEEVRRPSEQGVQIDQFFSVSSVDALNPDVDVPAAEVFDPGNSK